MQLDLGQPKVDFNSNILDIDIPKELENSVSTGHEYIDFLFAGDGIVPSTTAIITGPPGAGKSTLMLQAADLITGSGNIALYNTGEESLYQIRRHTKRLNIRSGFVPGYNACVDEIIEQLEKLRASNPGKQIFLIQDSVQCLLPSKFDCETGEFRKGRKKGGLAAQLDALITLCKYAKEHFVIMLFINHLTKDGKMAGLNAVKHLVDAHLHLGFETDKKSDMYGERIVVMEKNRFGITSQILGFDISATGLNFSQPAREVDEEVVDAREDALIDRLIRDMDGFTPVEKAG